MAAIYARQVLYAVLLSLMGAVVWTTYRADQLELQARTMWRQPSPQALTMLADSDEATTRPSNP